SPDGQRAAAIIGDVKADIFNITIFDVAAAKILHTYHLGTPNPTTLTWSPDGARLAISSADWRFRDARSARFKVFNMKTYELDWIESGANAYVWSPDGKRLAGVNLIDNSFRIVRASNGDVLRTTASIRTRNYSLGQIIHWSPDGKQVLAAGHNV